MFPGLRGWRNQVTRLICNFMLKHVATEEYRSKIDLLIKQGMFHAQFGGPYVRYVNTDETPEPEEARD